MRTMHVPAELVERLRRSGVVELRQKPPALALRQMNKGERFRVIPCEDGKPGPGLTVEFDRLEGQLMFAKVLR